MSGDPEELCKVRDLWISLGWRGPEVDIEELRCTGCSADNKCAYPQLRDCAYQKELKNCGMCDKYACTLVKTAFSVTEEKKVDAMRCSPEDWKIVMKAFGYKKKNLDNAANSRKDHSTHQF